MSVMICASIAYDTVMVFDGRFKEHILPDRIHMLSVSFLVPQMRRNFGGVGGNIAFNLALLGVQPKLMGTVGDDFDPYEAWMRQNGLALDHVRRIPGTYTAQAFITTDLDDNQITAFHPGALQHAGEFSVPRDAGITIGLVGPDSRDAMIAHAQQFADAGIPFIFDVGQGLPMFSGEDLRSFIREATWVIVNDYEGQLIQERTGLSATQIASRCSAYIVTRGAEGSRIYAGGKVGEIPAVAPTHVVDPTGCGDAYRAGIIYGLMHGLDWETTGRLASLLGSIKIAHHGTQTHRFGLEEIQGRFHHAFGYRF
jgi:adenosine kinase